MAASLVENTTARVIPSCNRIIARPFGTPYTVPLDVYRTIHIYELAERNGVTCPSKLSVVRTVSWQRFKRLRVVYNVGSVGSRPCSFVVTLALLQTIAPYAIHHRGLETETWTCLSFLKTIIPLYRKSVNVLGFSCAENILSNWYWTSFVR